MKSFSTVGSALQLIASLLHGTGNYQGIVAHGIDYCEAESPAKRGRTLSAAAKICLERMSYRRENLLFVTLPVCRKLLTRNQRSRVISFARDYGSLYKHVRVPPRA